MSKTKGNSFKGNKFDKFASVDLCLSGFLWIPASSRSQCSQARGLRPEKGVSAQ